MKQKRLETVETLAARFGLPRRTIVREVMRCRLPYVSIAGKWRFRERDVELWVDRAGSMPNLLLMQGGKATGFRIQEPTRAESCF